MMGLKQAALNNQLGYLNKMCLNSYHRIAEPPTCCCCLFVFFSMVSTHPSIPSLHHIAPFVLPNCQESCISFEFKCYPQDTNCRQPAAVFSSPPSSLTLFTIPSLLSPCAVHFSGRAADRCGRRWGRWWGWQQKLFRGKWKPEDVKEKMNPAHTRGFMHSSLAAALFAGVSARHIL